MGMGSQLEVWRKMWPVTALCLVLGALIGIHVTVGSAASPDDRFLFIMGTLPLVLAWFASPSIAFALSRPAILGEVHLTEAERQASLRYAKLHWMYFEKFVTEETQWLAPGQFPGRSGACARAPHVTDEHRPAAPLHGERGAISASSRDRT